MSTLSPASGLSRLTDARGFGLIEVIVSAMVIVLVSLGVYAGLDGASASSGVNKHRSLASGLAQQDQDRMRAMTVGELSNYRDVTTQTVAGVDYTTTSVASWVTDSTGSASCSAGSAQANYLSISSTVTWANMPIDPIVIQSIVAPPSGSFGSSQGSLAVQVRDRNGVGVAGVSVSLSGAASYADLTNAAGCVLWGYLPVGNYNVAVAKTGYVDPNGVTNPVKAVGVVGAATNTVAFDYDLGGRITGQYQTWNGTSVVPANGLSFTATNANLTVPLAPFGDGAAHTSFTTGLVYPFTVGYALYAGDCAGAAVPTGQPAQKAIVTPGATLTVNLRQPPVNLRAMNGLTPVGNATVKLTATGTGCSAVTTRTTAADGFMTDRSMPYGSYSYCVSGAVGASTLRRVGTITNNLAAGSALPTDVDLAGGVSGACP